MNSFTQWLQATGFSMFIRGSLYAYPVILALHMVAIALFGGMILMTDLRLLGWTAGGLSVSDVVDRLRAPKIAGFIFAATCGLLLLIGNPEKYLANIFFRIKLVLFVLVALHALAFRRGVYRQAAELDTAPRMPARARLAACLSLLLWFSIACAGRGIGYIVYRPD